MPRNGDGSSDNGPIEEAKQDIIHGAGEVESDRVARADKTADLPEGKDEQGKAIPGLSASGGQSQTLKKGDDVGQGGRGN
ncbi:hypothetical protein AK830_g1437 [Neonectria ditissima]|uniref:Uncharacterized protein n=1 Tax=Neonectria ditissima TaxID=78410 RepID=A0A0P7BMP6_9HYPO|nr:hypothetical protein AK830_g1437 [Neonectria ditissima]